MGSPELSGKWNGRENEVHSAITYPNQTPGKAANFPACSSTAWMHGPCLPPGSTELMAGTRSPSAAPFPQAVQRAAAGRQCREPARAVLSPCPAGPQPSEQHPGNPGSAGLWRRRPRPRSALFPWLCSTPTPSTFSWFCINPKLIQHTQIWDLFSGCKQGYQDIHNYTERVHKLKIESTPV